MVAITFSSQNHENLFYNIFILKSCCCSFSPGACPEHVGGCGENFVMKIWLQHLCQKIMILWQKRKKWHFCDENVITIFELKVIHRNARNLSITHFHHKIMTILLICFITHSSQNYHSCLFLHFHHKVITFWSICYLHISIKEL